MIGHELVTESFRWEQERHARRVLLKNAHRAHLFHSCPQTYNTCRLSQNMIAKYLTNNRHSNSSPSVEVLKLSKDPTSVLGLKENLVWKMDESAALIEGLPLESPLLLHDTLGLQLSLLFCWNTKLHTCCVYICTRAVRKCTQRKRGRASE